MPSKVDIGMWEEIQEQIWRCDLCHDHTRVARNIRQRTQAPAHLVKLMLVGVAPPYTASIERKSVADSATNNPNDNLRAFIVKTLGEDWETLLSRGLYLVHGVKCAITPKDRHQNPPLRVIDACAPHHFVQEILQTQPSALVVFGKAPFRALLHVPSVRLSMPRGLGLSCSVADLIDKTKGGIQVSMDNWNFRLFGSPFPLQALSQSVEILREAARHAGLVR